MGNSMFDCSRCLLAGSVVRDEDGQEQARTQDSYDRSMMNQPGDTVAVSTGVVELPYCFQCVIPPL